MPNRVVVAGSRSIEDYDAVKEAIENSGFDIDVIVSGGARGVDRMGEIYGKENAIPVQICPADWDKHGKVAGLKRNEKMADYASALVAVWDGESSGTEHMIQQAYNRNMPIVVYFPHNDRFKRYEGH